ncbi:MAG: hypothetical protein KL787_10290 [Taibaiella sp.]|nr:hypothetical protein [Taibaiella sp.]
MNLYKFRDFGMIFSDTFAFYKRQFKKLYSGLFRLIWIPLVLFLASLFVVSRLLDVSVIGKIEDLSGLSDIGTGMLLLSGLGGLILLISSVLLSLFTYSYTVSYLLLYRDYKDDFDYKDIVATMRMKSGKIIKYFLMLLALGFAAILLFSGLMLLMFAAISGSNELLIVILVIFLFLLVVSMLFLVPYVTLSIHNGFIEYMSTEGEGIWTCLNAGFRITRNSLGKNVGSYLVMSILVQIVSGFIAAIPSYLILFSAMMSGADDTAMMESMFLYYVVNIGLNVIVSTMVLPLLQTNMGIIYFSNQEQSEYIQSYSEIDEIGQ